MWALAAQIAQDRIELSKGDSRETSSWTATLPAGTSIAIQYRTGDTPTPDETWTSFTTVPASGGALSGTSRYLQFTVRAMTSESKSTPVVKDVTVTFRR